MFKTVPMKLYVCTEGRELSRRVAMSSGATALRSATVVLKHADGPVGFDRRPGRELLRVLLERGVFVAVANRPRWRRFESASAMNMAELGRVVVACSTPGDDLLSELDKVSLNELSGRKNAVLIRHGRHPTPDLPTRFDRWVTEDGRVGMADLWWMLGLCARLSLWARSTWGAYGVFLGSNEDEALGPVLRLQDVLGLPIERVEYEGSLPEW